MKCNEECKDKEESIKLIERKQQKQLEVNNLASFMFIADCLQCASEHYAVCKFHPENILHFSHSSLIELGHDIWDVTGSKFFAHLGQPFVKDSVKSGIIICMV